MTPDIAEIQKRVEALLASTDMRPDIIHWLTPKERLLRQGYEIATKDAPRLLAKLSTAQATIDKLPKTADGVPVVKGDTVYLYCRRTGLYRPREGCAVWPCAVRNCDFDDNHGWRLMVMVDGSHQEIIWAKDCHSTRAAAEAAAQEKSK